MEEKRNPSEKAQQQINVAKSNCEDIEGKISSQSQQATTKTRSMARIQKFSRIAAFLFVGILNVSVLWGLDIIGYRLRYLFILSPLPAIVLTIWFAFLLASSSGKPFLRMAAIYGVLTSLLYTFGELRRFSYCLTPINSEPSPSYSTRIIYKVICLSSFLLLALFFKRKSTLQILSICLATIPFILTKAPDLLREFVGYRVGSAYYIMQDIALLGLYIAFMYYFSKMKTK